jgi:WD40 repeat protein
MEQQPLQAFQRGQSPGTSVTPDPQELSPPAIPDHTLLHPIGEGSYGKVWLAVNVMGTRRAVKVVHRRDFTEDRPFEREFTGIRKFEPVSRSHEGLVDILQVGRDDRAGYFYYVMELADNANSSPADPTWPGPLSESRAPRDCGTYQPRTMRADVERRGRLPAQECVGIGILLASAIEHLHRHGLVHRDIKPSNIIFVNGQPKLADIGLVTDLDEARSLVGTQGFIPPEGPGTPQADVYSLGKVLYEISSGKDRQAFPEPPTRLAELPDQPGLLELDEVIHRACENDPRRRYQSAGQLSDDLLLLQAGKSVRRLRVVERRLKMVTRLALAGAAALLLGVVPYALAIKEARHARAAEADAKERLRGSYFAQAQAGRFSHRAGRRFEGLELVRKAAAMRPTLELRNEAIACLALRDMRLSREFGGLLPTTFVDFDLTGGRYARREKTGDISVRSLDDDRELQRAPGFGATAAEEFDFSPDGRLLALFKADKLGVVIWDVEHASPLLSLTNNFVRNAAFTMDGRVALAQRPNSIVVYDLRTQQRTSLFQVRSLPTTLKLRPDGAQLAVSFTGTDKVEIFDLPSGASSIQLVATDEIADLSWHPSGRWLAGAAADGNNVVWDFKTGERIALKANSSASIGISFNAKGTLLASTGWDGRLQLFDMSEGEEICSLPVNRYGTSFSPDSRWIGCGSDFDKIGLVEVALGEACTDLLIDTKAGKEPKCCSFSTDGQRMISAHKDGFRVWDVASYRQLAFQKTSAQVFSARFHPSRNSIITSSDVEVSEWPLAADEHDQSSLHIGPARLLAPATGRQVDYLGYNSAILALAGNQTVQLLEIASGKLVGELHGDADFHFADVSPDGKWCAAGTWTTNAAWVFDVQTGATKCVVPACVSPTSVTFSPNNEWLAIGGGGEYRFVRTGTWKMASKIARKDSSMIHGHLAFAPDGSMAALAYSAQTVRLVDPATGHEFATLEPRSLRNISALGFSPDGTRLAVGTWSQTIQMWDLRLIRNELVAMKLDWELPPYP